MAGSLAELRDLVASRKVAALGTLHDGAPYVSMVPFAMLEDGSAFLIHVSRLSGHTGDMLADPRVSLLIMGPESDENPVQALARVTILGEALPIDSVDRQALAKARYLERFPDAAPIFELGGFSLFAITPTALRWIGGFAAARSLSPETFAEAVRGGQ